MKMPISEILDRYTITKLKSERTNENVTDELQTYKRELNNPVYARKSKQIKSFIDRLYRVNGKLWETEGDIRKGIDMPLEEVGRLALKVRDLNIKRNEIKAEIVDTFSEGFKEIKVNYKKINYGGGKTD
ncbi:MAG: hypothetical protein VX890_01815 [Pseudomonadota bacterium]|nr:hypothetical protein [Pseudomonadota bacterium]